MSLRFLVAVAAVAALPAAANASPADVFGFGSQHAARAGAVSASVDDFAAGYYNPAGLAFGHGKRLTLGMLGAVSNLHANDERMPVSEPVGFILGAVTPAPLGGALENRIHVGIGLYAPPRTLVRIRSRLPDEPFFPYYDNRTQRLVVLPTIAVRVLDQLSIGVAVNFLATLTGKVQAAEGPLRSLDARVDEEVPSIARVNAGVRWRAHPSFDVALVYRQRFEIPFQTIANTEVAGQPIDLDVSSSALYTPHQVIVGGAFRHGPGEVTLDLGWANWSDYPGPYVEVSSQLPLLDPFAGELPDVPYKDTFSARVGGELAVDQWTVRAGYAFETSPFPAEQPGVTNLLDGPKHMVALGAGLQLGRVRVDVHGSAQMLAPRDLEKVVADPDAEDVDLFDALRDQDEDAPGSQITNAGYPNIRSSGQVFSGGATVEIAF